MKKASAGDVVEVDGIYYNLVDKSNEAEVTKNPNGNYRGSVDIPAYFEYGGETYRVYSIGDYAFQNCSELYSVTIPNTVPNIGMYAFSRSSITSMDIPNSVTYIGNGATIDVYTLAGVMVGSVKASSTSVSIDTNLRSGEIAIVKIGDKSVKVMIK